MPKPKNKLTPTLFQNYQDNPIYQWYHEELWHIYLELEHDAFNANSTKELFYRAKQIELRTVLEDRLKRYLREELDFTWDRSEEIIKAIKHCEYYERGGQGKEVQNG